MLKTVYFPPECPAVANMLTVLVQTGIEAGILVTLLIAEQHQLDGGGVPLPVAAALFSLGIEPNAHPRRRAGPEVGRGRSLRSRFNRRVTTPVKLRLGRALRRL